MGSRLNASANVAATGSRIKQKCFGHHQTSRKNGRKLLEGTHLKYVRKKLYVTDKTPAIAIEDNLYVRAGLTHEMKDNDLLVLALVLALKNHEWRNQMIERAKSKMIGASTNTSRVTRALELIGKEYD